MPATIPVKDYFDKSNFCSFVKHETLDRRCHLLDDIASDISPHLNRQPKTPKVAAKRMILASDMIKDINSQQKQKTKNMILEKVFEKINNVHTLNNSKTYSF